MKVEKQQDGGGHDAPLQEPACWRCDGGRNAVIAGWPESRIHREYFAALTRALQQQGAPEVVFAKALGWLPWYFVATVLVVAVAEIKLRSSWLDVARP